MTPFLPKARMSVLWPLLFGTYAFLFGLMRIADSDVWWHLATGRWIVAHHSVPTQDVFSFPTLGQPWQPNAWLSDVLFYLLHEVGGAELLSIAAAGIAAAAFAIAAWIAMRSGASPWIIAALVLAAAPMVRFRIMPRPHVFELLFAALALGILAGWPRTGFKRWLWMVPLMLLWANTHASFILGFILMGSFLVEALLARRWPALVPQSPSGPEWKWAGLAATGALAASFCTPFGHRLWSWVLRDFFSKTVAHSFEIEENARLAWGAHPLFWGWMIAGFLALALQWNKIRPGHALLFLLSSVLALNGIRFIAVAAIIQLPILAGALQGLLDTRGLRLSKHWAVKAAGLAIFAVAGASAFALTFTPQRAFEWGIGVKAGVVPDGGIRYLDQFPDMDRVYTSWDAGGYYLWAREGRLNFIDGRCSDAQMALYERMRSSDTAGLNALIGRYGVQAALVSTRDLLGRTAFASDPAFRFAYFDDQSLIFLRQDLHPEVGFAHLRPEFAEPSYLSAFARTPAAPAVFGELERALQEGGEGVRVRYLMGYFSEISGRELEAMEHYGRAFDANPRLALRHYPVVQRAIQAALGQKQWDFATALLSRARREDDSRELRFLQATVHYQAKKLALAEALYMEILNEDPKQVPTLINLGFLKIDQAQYAAAESYHQRVLNLAPQNAEALYGLGLAYAKSGRPQKAIHSWRRFLQEHPASLYAPRVARALREMENGQGPRAGN